MAKKRDSISNAVIRRLPRYYRHLDDLFNSGVVRISSGSLAEKMDLTASQIRQDLSCFGGFGQQGYGYNVEMLRSKIAEILGMQAGHTAVILGVGNLGRALMQNFPFRRNGVSLLAAFDLREDIINTEVNHVPVYSFDDLENFLSEHTVDIAVLTVPQSAAAEVSSRLVDAGITGLWNFTNVELPVKQPGVIIENVHFADSLLTLNYMIDNREDGGRL